MGSGQSSVKDIKIEQSDIAVDKQKKKGQNVLKDPETNPTSQKNEDSSKQSSGTADLADKDAEIASLTKQLCDSESQRLDLEDRVQALEERIQELNNQTLMTENKPCDETLHVKDQYISKLEKEKKNLETESNKLKQKHRRKMKQLNSQMAEFKQETHFEMMELKDEIQKLTEENCKLKGSSKDEMSCSSLIENTPKLPGGEKMKLILELSEQVTEQGDKIGKLERKVKDRDQTIEELRVRLKNNTDYLKATDQAGLSARGERISTSARGDKSQATGKQYWGSSSTSSVSSYRTTNTINVRKFNDEVSESVWGSSASTNNSNVRSASKFKTRQMGSEIDDLFAIQGDVKDDNDDDLDNSASMKKLSDLLIGTKADDEKARESFEALNSDRHESDNRLYQIEEENLDSGNGRDSGLGSAGKRANENNVSDIGMNSHKNWRESSALSFESEMSDSDSVTDLRLQNKVSSAPPKLQNQGNPKLKKKSRSLRKHIADKTDRPPRPGMAFVNSSENGAIMSNSNVTNSNKIPSVLSPVNVS